MNMLTAALLLLLALPACGQLPSARQLAEDTFGVKDDGALVWITVRVDSLNLGTEHGIWTDAEWVDHGWVYQPGDLTRWHGGPVANLQIWSCPAHEWVYSAMRFKSRAQLPPEPPLDDPEMWMWTERERICRICLRHEWQAQKIVSPQPVLSPFDSLKARLRTGATSEFPVLGPTVPISPEADRAN